MACRPAPWRAVRFCQPGGAHMPLDRGASRQVLYAALVSPTRVQNGGDGDESGAPPHLNLNVTVLAPRMATLLGDDGVSDRAAAGVGRLYPAPAQRRWRRAAAVAAAAAAAAARHRRRRRRSGGGGGGGCGGPCRCPPRPCTAAASSTTSPPPPTAATLRRRRRDGRGYTAGAACRGAGRIHPRTSRGRGHHPSPRADCFVRERGSAG